MATSFPTSLDTLTNPLSTDTLNSSTVPHATQHADANDAIEALQAKVGINGSLNTNSLDNKVADLISRTTGTNTGDQNLSTYTNQGNTFNGASQLVKLDATGKLPAVDGSLLTGISAGSSNPNTIVSNNFYLFYPDNINSNATGMGVGNITYRPIIIKKSFTAQALAIRVLSTVVINIKMGIYSSNPLTPLSLTLVHEATLLTTTTSAGDYVVPIVGNVALDSSLLYWIAIEADSASLSGLLSTGKQFPENLGNTQVALLSTAHNAINQAHTFGTAFPVTTTLSMSGATLYTQLVALKAL